MSEEEREEEKRLEKERLILLMPETIAASRESDGGIFRENGKKGLGELGLGKRKKTKGLDRAWAYIWEVEEFGKKMRVTRPNLAGMRLID